MAKHLAISTISQEVCELHQQLLSLAKCRGPVFLQVRQTPQSSDKRGLWRTLLLATARDRHATPCTVSLKEQMAPWRCSNQSEPGDRQAVP